MVVVDDANVAVLSLVGTIDVEEIIGPVIWLLLIVEGIVTEDTGPVVGMLPMTTGV